MDTPFATLDTRLLSTGVESQCPRYREEADEEAVTKRDDFEDTIINLYANYYFRRDFL